MSVRYYSSADAHLATVTHATPIIDTTTTPYSLRLGAYVAQTDYSVGVAAYCVLAVPAGADILRADCSLAGPGGEVTNPGGRVRLDIGTTLRVQATAGLPSGTGGTPGTFVRLGTVTLAEHADADRTASAEGKAAMDARLLGSSALTDYCGATIWRGHYALPIGGGHAGTYDDGFYAQSLTTGAWSTVVGVSDYAGVTEYTDAYGEWTDDPGDARPASQHSYSHVVAVGDDIIQGHGGAVGSGTGDSGVNIANSRQAHRYNYGGTTWERYGDLAAGSTGSQWFVHYDASRSRLVRMRLNANSAQLDTISSNDAGAAWTQLTIDSGGLTSLGIGADVGYHAGLDCYVRFGATGEILTMGAANLTDGWTASTTSGDEPPISANTGLAYCPPKTCMVAADIAAPLRLYYLTPTGARTAAWVWSYEDFTAGDGSGMQSWNTSGGNAAGVGVHTRVQWSSALSGLVLLKHATKYTEVFYPTV